MATPNDQRNSWKLQLAAIFISLHMIALAICTVDIGLLALHFDPPVGRIPLGNGLLLAFTSPAVGVAGAFSRNRLLVACSAIDVMFAVAWGAGAISCIAQL